MSTSVVIRIRKTTLILSVMILGACAAPDATLKKEKKTSREAQQSSARKGGSDASSFDVALKRSLAYLDKGNPKNARFLLEKLATTHKDKGVVFNALGVAYKRQGMLNEAVKAYKKALLLQEGYIEAHYNLAIAYREGGKFKKAEAEYHKALSIDPKFGPAHYNLAILYDLYMNRATDSLKHYKEYRNLEKGDESLEVWIQDLERRVERSRPRTKLRPIGDTQ